MAPGSSSPCPGIRSGRLSSIAKPATGSAGARLSRARARGGDAHVRTPEMSKRVGFGVARARARAAVGRLPIDDITFLAPVIDSCCRYLDIPMRRAQKTEHVPSLSTVRGSRRESAASRCRYPRRRHYGSGQGDILYRRALGFQVRTVRGCFSGAVQVRVPWRLLGNWVQSSRPHTD